jgi:phosphoglycerate dehydrogenase-like enzyme
MTSENHRAPLFLCVAPSGLEPSLSAFRHVMGARPFDVFDAADGGEPDFSGRRAVVDLGGWGTREQTAKAVAARVELWHVFGYGLDHLDLEYLLSKGVIVAHTPGSSSAVALAEQAMMLMLNCSRAIREQMANLEKGEFWRPWTNELAGSRLLLLGVGASGRELALRAASFQMDVIGVDIVVGEEESYRRIGISSVQSPDALYGLLPTADVISLHLPLTNDTTHVLDAAALGRVKHGAMVINVARGALIDEHALLNALNDGSVGAAGLDVFEHEVPGYWPDIARHPHVFATPHTAGVTYQTAARRAQAIVDNLDRLQNREPISDAVSPGDNFAVTQTPDK